MNVNFDTNIFVSGVFFHGAPHEILVAWGRGLLQLVVSQPILDEYLRVGEELSERFGRIELKPVYEMVLANGKIVIPRVKLNVVKDDPSDNKFLECALAAGGCPIVTGDGHLLKFDQFRGIPILKPRKFVDEFLKGI